MNTIIDLNSEVLVDRLPRERTGSCVMRIRSGLTTWNLCLGRVAFMWRWNMSLREALRTCELHRFRRGHGYATAGPLILEW
jgi:hypothetical protein